MEVWYVCLLQFLLISCVQSNKWRMFGGRSVKPGEYPYLVFVVADRLNIRYCTGSILSSTWILTAAHCLRIEEKNIPARKFKVFAGITNYETPETTVQASNGRSMVIHPDYKLFNVTNFTDLASYNDLGLLQLEHPLTFNSFVSDIHLSAMLPTGEKMIDCSAIGFGQTEEGNTKRLKAIEVLKVTRCTDTDDRELGALYDNDDYLCGYAGRDIFPANGDSGSPMVCGNNVVGVCFWVKKLNEMNDKVMIHTAVRRFIPWILSHVGDLVVND
ncbi:hypothetical protein C0J52_10327 [Blattella germanica]|nr:hypothetical protein C0J52_10327 [Blattella germanica]